MPSPRLRPLLPPGWRKVCSVLYSSVFSVCLIHSTCSLIHSVSHSDSLRDDRKWEQPFLNLVVEDKSCCLPVTEHRLHSPGTSWMFGQHQVWCSLVGKRTSYFLAHWWSFRGLLVCLDPCPLDLYLLHVFLLDISPLSTCLLGQDHRSKAPVLARVTAQPFLTIISWRVDLNSCKVSKLGCVYL